MRRKAVSAMVVLLALAAAGVQAEGIPQMINYQGILLDGDGKPVTGNRSVEFLMYETETGGSALWSETQNITLAEGLFSVLLGSVTPIPSAVFDSTAVYLTLKVGSDGEMTPRKRLVSTAYSYRALEADRLGGHAPEDFVRGGQPGSVTAEMLVPSFLGSVDGVSNAGGNVDLVAGSNVTITPNDEANTVTISATGGGTGDNLGDHTATQNLRLNGHWLSNDGANKGVWIDNLGNATLSGNIVSSGTIFGSGAIHSDDYISAASDISSSGGNVRTGSPSSSYDSGDLVSTDDVIADDQVVSGGSLFCHSNMAIDGVLGIGSGGWDTGSALSVYGNSALSGNLSVWNNLTAHEHCGIHGAVSSTYSLKVEGSAYCTGSWNSSDLSLKRNVVPAAGSASRLFGLRGVSFEWKRDEYPEREFAAGTQYGLIAQEVEAVYPELVRTDEKGEKAINYIGLIPLMLEALKSQQKTIDALRSRVDQLQAR